MDCDSKGHFLAILLLTSPSQSWALHTVFVACSALATAAAFKCWCELLSLRPAQLVRAHSCSGRGVENCGTMPGRKKHVGHLIDFLAHLDKTNHFKWDIKLLWLVTFAPCIALSTRNPASDSLPTFGRMAPWPGCTDVTPARR